jgi:transposase
VKQQYPDQSVEVWFQDEARFGQQGTLTSVWAEKGSRPTAVKQTEYQWLYCYAAVNPHTGESVALLVETVSAVVMSIYLAMISKQVGPGRHVVLVLDQAGWHVARHLKVPANITLLHLPPYSPELNPVERLWAYLKSHNLSNRVFDDYNHLLDQTSHAWRQFDESRLRSLCHTEWVSTGAK